MNNLISINGNETRDMHNTQNPEIAAVNFHQQAKLYSSQGKLDEAVAACEQALDIQPDFPEACKMMGNLLQAKGKVEAARDWYTKAIKIQPDYAEALANIGTLYALQGECQQAISFYQKALASQPNFAGVYRNLARIFSQLGKWQESGEAWYQAFILEPEQVTAQEYLNLGNTFLDRGKLEKAIVCYESAIRIQPDISEVHCKLELALQKTSKIIEDFTGGSPAMELNSDSIEVCYKLLNNQPHNFESYLNLGNALVKQNQGSAAIINYRHAIELNPHSYDGWYRLGLVLANQEIFEEAISCYRRALELNSDSIEVHSDLWTIINQRQNWAEATTWYRLILEKQPDSAVTYYYLGTALSCQELWEEATISCRRGIELNPGYFYLHLLLGTALTQLEKWEEVVAAYRYAINFNPTFDGTYSYLGDALLKCSKWEEAIAAYRRALELAPEAHGIHQKLTEAIRQRTQSDLAETIAWYRRIIELNPDQLEAYYSLLKIQPDNFEVYFELANVLVQQNKLEEAVANYRRAIELNPRSWNCYINLGETLMQQGNLDEATACFCRAIECDLNRDESYKKLEEVFRQKGKLDPEPSSQGWSWQQLLESLARGFYISGRFDKAMRLLLKATEIQNELVKAYQLDKLGIRFITYEWGCAIGHTALLDYYFKMNILGWLPQQRTILWMPAENIANPCYMNYWRDYFQIEFPVPEKLTMVFPLVKYLKYSLGTTTLPNGQTVSVSYGQMMVQKQWEAEGRSHLLTLSDADGDRGWRCLEELGVPKDAWFVSLHVRDTGCSNGQWNGSTRAGRNAHIDTYLLAIQSIVARGGWVIRMGDRNMKPLPKTDGVIDYAHSEAKSDWMDVFLWAKCRFFIGTCSGPAHVPPTFGVPCAQTNWASLQFRSSFSQDILIPKLYWHEKEQRYLTFAEMLSPAYIVCENIDFFASVGVKVVDNTPQEINDLVLEIIERLEGTIHYAEYERLLQEQFNKLVDPDGIYGGARIGRAFLGKYAHLLPNG
ncbi:tetratricopeptide repeat protein [Microcoleus sp. S13_C3]